MFGVLARIQEANCPSQVDPSRPKDLLKVCFAMMTIATVGLKKGATSLPLKVGVVSAMMQDSIVTLLEKAPLTEVQAGVANAATASVVTFIAASLAVGVVPAVPAAAFVTIAFGLLGAEVALAQNKVDADNIIQCGVVGMTVKDTEGDDVHMQIPPPSCKTCTWGLVFNSSHFDQITRGDFLCETIKWGNEALRYLPTIVTMLVAVFGKGYADRKAAKKAKATGVVPATALDKMNSAVTGSQFITSSVVAWMTAAERG